MATIIDYNERLKTKLSLAEAESIAGTLNEQDDDGWTYRIEPHGAAHIVVVYDEAGARLGPI